MNKAELITHVADASELSKADAGKGVDAVFGAIAAALKVGDDVTLVGFGSFSVSNKAARPGRNPRTGEPVEIAARRVPAFKAGKTLKEVVNG